MQNFPECVLHHDNLYFSDTILILYVSVSGLPLEPKIFLRTVVGHKLSKFARWAG